MKPPDRKKEPVPESANSRTGEAEAPVSIAGRQSDSPSAAAFQLKSEMLEGDPLEIDRRKISVGEHAEFLASLLRPKDYDEIEEDLDDSIVVDPYEHHAPSRRSDKDLARLLDLIDTLPTGNRKETTR